MAESHRRAAVRTIFRAACVLAVAWAFQSAVQGYRFAQVAETLRTRVEFNMSLDRSAAFWGPHPITGSIQTWDPGQAFELYLMLGEGPRHWPFPLGQRFYDRFGTGLPPPCGVAMFLAALLSTVSFLLLLFWKAPAGSEASTRSREALATAIAACTLLLMTLIFLWPLAVGKGASEGAGVARLMLTIVSATVSGGSSLCAIAAIRQGDRGPITIAAVLILPLTMLLALFIPAF